jgi:hypothetical protein
MLPKQPNKQSLSQGYYPKMFDVEAKLSNPTNCKHVPPTTCAVQAAAARGWSASDLNHDAYRKPFSACAAPAH